MKFWDNVGDPCTLQLLADCLCHVSFRRYSPLCIDVAKNRTKKVFFAPNFLWRENPNFSTADV